MERLLSSWLHRRATRTFCSASSATTSALHRKRTMWALTSQPPQIQLYVVCKSILLMYVVPSVCHISHCVSYNNLLLYICVENLRARSITVHCIHHVLCSCCSILCSLLCVMSSCACVCVFVCAFAEQSECPVPCITAWASCYCPSDGEVLWLQCERKE